MPPLLQDLSDQIGVIRQRLVPDATGLPAGYALRIVDDAGSVAFQQDADEEIIKGVGDPNTVYRGTKGQLYVDKSLPALWQNSDGYKAWTAVGAGAGSGFPVGPLDDATDTYTITAGSDILRAVNQSDANDSYADMQLVVFSGQGIAVLTAQSSDDLTASMAVTAPTGGPTKAGFDADRIELNSGVIVVGTLPTSDPGIAGHLWNNAGVVNVSP